MLSVRLNHLRQHFRDESSIWDIGCDHGLLGLSFAEFIGVKEIHLVDPSLPVINELKSKLKDSYISKPHLNISTHHMKGQDITLSPKKNLIFIAGMGGTEIKKIIESLLPQLSTNDRIVISPHRKIFELRNYLGESPLRLESETIVYEQGQFYQVICLSLDSSFPQVSPYGEALWNSEVGELYRIRQLETFSLHEDMASQDYVTYLKCLPHRN